MPGLMLPCQRGCGVAEVTPGDLRPVPTALGASGFSKANTEA